MISKINVTLDSFNKTYREGETIKGLLEISCSEDINYNFIIAEVIGQFTFKNTKVEPPISTNTKFYNSKTNVSNKGKLNSNKTNIFNISMPLESINQNKLYESYQGVIVTITYELIVNFSDIKKSEPLKIHIYVPGQGLNPDFKTKILPYEFDISPKTIEKIKIDATKIPDFLLKCRIDNCNADIGKELNGWLKVIRCDIGIKSIELQFVRNEKLTLCKNNNNQTFTELSEIQNLQIGDGEVLLDNEISLNMLFPRHFCCANLETNEVKLYFDINIILVLENGYVITENVPLNCYRG